MFNWPNCVKAETFFTGRELLWISFLIGKRLSLLKKLLTNSDITVYVCDELIQEFKDVSQRGKIRKYIFEQDIWDTLKIMDAYCHFVSIKTKAQSPIRDAKDSKYKSFASLIGDWALVFIDTKWQYASIIFKVSQMSCSNMYLRIFPL